MKLMITIQASLGEVIDKISILNIKQEKLKSPEALANVCLERNLLKSALQSASMDDALTHPLFHKLAEVNAKLWKVEDDLRDLESQKTFDTKFIDLARSVYHLNDSRASIKRELNLVFGSQLIEEKSYKAY